MIYRNRDIKNTQTIPHTGGAMSLSRRRNNLVYFYLYLAPNYNIFLFFCSYIIFFETCKKLTLVRILDELNCRRSHKKKNDTYVNDEAMEIEVTLYL